MGKIDEAILEALAQITISSAKEHENSSGTENEHICCVRMNFMKHFMEDVYFLNEHSEDETFLRRYGNLIIRNMLEQLMEFLYLMKNPYLAEEYLGMTIKMEEINKKESIVKKEEMFGKKRYNEKLSGRPSISEIAKNIGEKSSTDGKLTLYKLYQILSERCHNSYYSSLLDDVNKVHFSVSNAGLNESQIKDVHIMTLFVLDEFKDTLKEEFS